MLLARRPGSPAGGPGGGYIGAHLSYVEGVGVSPRAALEPADPPLPGAA